MADLRAARIGVIVNSKSHRKWIFTFTADRHEKRTREDAKWQVYDLEIEIPIGPVKLTLGKQEEPFSFEMVGLFPTLPRKGRISVHGEKHRGRVISTLPSTNCTRSRMLAMPRLLPMLELAVSNSRPLGWMRRVPTVSRHRQPCRSRCAAISGAIALLLGKPSSYCAPTSIQAPQSLASRPRVSQQPDRIEMAIWRE